MGDRWGLEAELGRLRPMERELGKPQESIFDGKTKKKRQRPKGGPEGQMGTRAPSATGLYEPLEDEKKK